MPAHSQKKRLESRKAEGVELAKELVSEFLIKLNKSKYVALENRYEWMTPKELEAAKKDNSPAVPPVIFGGKEKAGYAPKMLFGKKVRRFGPWQQHRQFKKVGGLEEGYNIIQVFFRVVEIGGSDIDAEPIIKATPKDDGRFEDPTGEFMDDPRGTVPPPRGVPGRGEDPEFMGPEGGPEGGGDIIPEAPKSEIPEDIGDREYVFQYTIYASTRRRKITVSAAVELTMKPKLTVTAPAVDGGAPEKLMGFPLADDETKLTMKNTFRIPNGWSGWILGSKEMTFNQMISDYGFGNLNVKATVK